MSSVLFALKEEIGRLSRREIKKTVPSLKKRVAVLVRALAAQKRVIAELGQKVARLESLAARYQPAVATASPEEVKKARVSARLVRSQRQRLKLSQELFAKLLGISPAAVRSWEQGRSSPRAQNLAAFVSVRKLNRKEVYERLGIKPRRKRPTRRK